MMSCPKHDWHFQYEDETHKLYSCQNCGGYQRRKKKRPTPANVAEPPGESLGMEA